MHLTLLHWDCRCCRFTHRAARTAAGTAAEMARRLVLGQAESGMALVRPLGHAAGACACVCMQACHEQRLQLPGAHGAARTVVGLIANILCDNDKILVRVALSRRGPGLAAVGPQHTLRCVLLRCCCAACPDAPPPRHQHHGGRRLLQQRSCGSAGSPARRREACDGYRLVSEGATPQAAAWHRRALLFVEALCCCKCSAVQSAIDSAVCLTLTTLGRLNSCLLLLLLLRLLLLQGHPPLQGNRGDICRGPQRGGAQPAQIWQVCGLCCARRRHKAAAAAAGASCRGVGLGGCLAADRVRAHMGEGREAGGPGQPKPAASCCLLSCVLFLLQLLLPGHWCSHGHRCGARAGAHHKCGLESPDRGGQAGAARAGAWGC